MEASTNKWHSLLNKIVWGLKIYIDTLLVTMGGVRKPLGFDLLAEYPDIKNYATVAILIGLVALLRAYYLVRRKEKRERTEREKETQQYTDILFNIL